MLDVANAVDGGFPQGAGRLRHRGNCAGPTASGDQLAVGSNARLDGMAAGHLLVFVAAPVPLAIDVTIADLDTSTVEMEAAISRRLQDAFLVIGEVAGTI